MRQIDPSEPDVYVDALLGPLYHKYERIQKENQPAPRCSDYFMVGLFLLLNVVLQLAIAFKCLDMSRLYGVGGVCVGGCD